MKDEKTISASEINRYLFCNYQWYYERKYGAKELRRLKKEHLEEMGIIADEANSPIQRGLSFHSRFEKNRRLRMVYIWLRAAVIAAIVIYLFLSGGFGVI
ncbi:MAG: hypothetical protein FWE34_08590 [Defluviitaleaceae bacterium]|nr:hypothetical protein [Defluviitaleaceae bacterium]